MWPGEMISSHLPTENEITYTNLPKGSVPASASPAATPSTPSPSFVVNIVNGSVGCVSGSVVSVVLDVNVVGRHVRLGGGGRLDVRRRGEGRCGGGGGARLLLLVELHAPDDLLEVGRELRLVLHFQLLLRRETGRNINT